MKTLQRLNQLFHEALDQKLTPADRAAAWVEYTSLLKAGLPEVAHQKRRR